MTILPTKRTTASNPEETVDGNQQNNNNDRRRDEHSISQMADTSTANRRSQFSQYGTNSERKDRCFKKRYKDSERSRDREREREQKREARREQKRDRVAKRETSSEPILDASAPSSSVVPVAAEPVCNPVENGLGIIQEDCSGFNSEDEYDCQNVIKNRHLTDEEWQARDELFSRCIANLGFEIKQMNEDGACLFRSIADQVYGDQELHFTVRTYCMDYIVKNKDYFAPYVTEDFDKYIARKRQWNVHGNHLEIQAMSEMYNRTIEVYCYQIEPINIFNGSNIINANEPIRLSYHRMCHYNSISNPNNPSVGVGLGLPNYHTIDLNRRRFNDAVRASEELLIEQTMLEDKLKATDWEATNEAIQEEVARESYIQYLKEKEKQVNKDTDGRSVASASASAAASTSKSSPRTPKRGGSVSPKGNQSPKAGASNHSPTTPVGSPKGAFVGFETDHFEDISPSYSPMSKDSLESSPKKQSESDWEYLHQPGTSSSCIKTTKTEVPPIYPHSHVPPSSFQEAEGWNEKVILQVMEESRRTYLEELKKYNTRTGSQGSSTDEFAGFEYECAEETSPRSINSQESSPKKEPETTWEDLYEPGTSAPTLTFTNSNAPPFYNNYHVLPSSFEEEEEWHENDKMILRVMEESRSAYLEELKSKKNGSQGSPTGTFIGLECEHFKDDSSMSKDSLESSPKKQQETDWEELYQAGTSAPSITFTNTNASPKCNAGWDEKVILRVMEESRRSYLEELKKNNHKRTGSGSSSSS